MMQLQYISQRLQQLNEGIVRLNVRVEEYQIELEDEEDPNRRSRYRRRIEQIREQLNSYQQECNSLQVQFHESQSIQMQPIASELKRLNRQVNALGNLVLESHQDLRRTLLEKYSSGEKAILTEVTQYLNQSQLHTVQAVLQAIDENRISTIDMQHLVAEVCHNLLTLEEKNLALPKSGQKIAETLNDPALDFRHKLKICLPIIPFLLDYEGEIELGTGFNLKALWERCVEQRQNY